MVSKRVMTIGVVLSVGALFAFKYFQPMNTTISQSETTTTTLPVHTMRVGSQVLRVEVATTPQEHAQGLSGRTSLPEGTGMVFVFQKPVVAGFWMKDMNFSLDMLWVDASGTIVTISKNLAPRTYPHVFYPSSPVVYVLEVPAGWAERHGIAEGAKIVLQ